MEPCPRCSGTGSQVEGFGRLHWLVCRSWRVEIAIDHADCRVEVH
jgi:hypothetical protein